MLEVKRQEEKRVQENVFLKMKEILFKDKLFWIMAAIIFVKTIIIIGLIGTEKANGINFLRGFNSDPNIFIYASFAITVLSISFLFRGRAHLWALIIIDILVTILIIGDLWYYRGFNEFLNFFLLFETSNLNKLSDSIKSMLRYVDFIFIIDIIVFIIYACANREVYRGVKRNIYLFLITLIVPICYVCYASIKIDNFDRGFNGQHAFYRSWAPTRTMSYLGPVGYHVLDAYNFVEVSRKYELTNKDKIEINNWYSKNKENLPDNQYAGMFKGKNLIIIQWESLENFVINQKIQGQEITPTLNKLLKSSMYFSNYHENVNCGTSSDADLMTNTGVYPVRDGSTFFRYPDHKYVQALPKQLEAMGYSTYAIHPDKGFYWNWKPALTSIGFHECYDSSYYNIHETIGLGISDKDYLPQVVPIIEKEKQPFYSFVVTLTSHTPFKIPSKDKTLKLNNGFQKNVLGDYLQCIHYTDTALGNFLDSLKKKGLLDNTVVVIYGDHTGVHKYYSDKVDKIKSSEDWWSSNEMRVPLIIYNSSLKAQTFDIQAGQIDLLPTVSYLMGIDKEKYQDKALGKVLVNTKKRYTILNDYTMLGQYTEQDEKHARDGIRLADKMIQANYFEGN